MSRTIQKPTPGRVVEFRNNEGQQFVGFVERAYEAGAIDVNYFDRGTIRFASSITHNADGGPSSWRYPPRSEETVEVER